MTRHASPREELRLRTLTPQRFYSLAQAANVIGVSVSTVRRLIRKGQLGAVRVGGQLRVHVFELDKLARASEAPMAPVAGIVRRPRLQLVKGTGQ